MMHVADLQLAVFESAQHHGFWEKTIPVPTLLNHIISEVFEAEKAYKDGNMEAFHEEMADIVLMCLSAAGGYGFDMESELLKKHEINLGRPYLHGRKTCN